MRRPKNPDAELWRLKREEVIDHYGEACTSCDSENGKLNVHHRYYESGKKQWDYPVETLDLLCDSCHGKADDRRRKIVEATGYLCAGETERATGYMRVLLAEGCYPTDDPIVRIDTYEEAMGVADALRTTPEEVLALIPRGQKFANWSDLAGLSDLKRHRVYRELRIKP